MRKATFLIILLFMCVKFSSAQFILEQVYDTATATSFYYNKFQQNGDKYINILYPESQQYPPIPQQSYEMRIYNLNHSIWKIIDLSNLPRPASQCCGSAAYGFLYLSDSLFDTDNLVEFMYVTRKIDTLSSQQDIIWRFETFIFNENGVLLFNDTSGPFYSHLNVPQTQVPIVNTSVGTKMMLATGTGSMKVFSLAGRLSTFNKNSITDLELGTNIYPNPTTKYARIQFQLPPMTNVAAIKIYSLSGQLMKSYNVDNSFADLIISTEDLSPGTYVYVIETEDHIIIQGKKFVTLGE